jgi:hypothetical protein
MIISEGKVRYHLITGHEGQNGEYRYLYSFFNLDARLGWVVKATPRSLYSRQRNPVLIVKEAGRAEAENLAAARAVQSVASCYTDCAIAE